MSPDNRVLSQCYMVRNKIKILAIDNKQNLELNETHLATLNLLEDIKRENEARKKTEDGLRESEERYRLLINTANEAVIVAQKSLIKFVNPMTLALFGVLSEQELIDRPFSEFIHPDDRSMVAKNHRRRIANKSIPPRYDFRIISSDGIVRWVEINVAFIEWQARPATLNLLTDITERKKFELEVRTANEQLKLLNQYQIEAREEERASISLEIHDELGQALTALKLDMNWVRGNIHDISNSVEKLGKMIEITNDIIKRVQRISSELRPGMLDDLGLASTIEWYCDEFEQRTGIKCNLAVEDSLFWDSKSNLTLFRILQEALTNVIRHSRASSVNIDLHYSKQEIIMTIEDNGIGIPFEKIKSCNSLGLFGMRERARQCGGKVEFVSKEKKGTKIMIFITDRKNNSHENTDC